MHDISYGIDLSHTDTHEKRDGHTLTLRTGAISKTVGMETFPVRDFPITETRKAGAYLQDEIALGILLTKLQFDAVETPVCGTGISLRGYW